MPRQTKDIELQKRDVGTEKRRPTPRDPEKRRQQNIRAQRKYREKLRQRMSYLEGLAASTIQSGGTGTTVVTAISQSGTVSTQTLSNGPGDIILNDPVCYSGSDIPASYSSPSTQGEWHPLIPQPDDVQTMGTQSDSTIYTPQFDDTTSAPQSAWSSMIDSPHSNDSSLALSTWDSTMGFSHLPDASSTLNPQKHLDSRHNFTFQPDWTVTIDCGCSTPHLQFETQGPAPFNSGNIRILRIRQNVADPYANNLRIEQLCTLSAIHFLALHLGISEAAMCADESLSPFFRPIMDSADNADKEKALSEVKQIYKVLKPDLRPNREQITIQHHPYIDIFPFPTLRKNLIIHQTEVDEGEFFFDMLSGLVCWGGAGIGQKDRDNSTGYASTGTPWDVRSWEAKAWFLEKYWNFLGGEDGELVRQSEWWCSIRGD